MKTIAVDAMGSDQAPWVEVEGAVEAARTGKVRVVLVGPEARLRPHVAEIGGELPITIHHASEVITMDDTPATAVRRKRDASMRVAAELVKRGEADALVSAGNSGAIVACGLFVIKRIVGVDRPGILTTFPTRSSEAVLMDTGANVNCKALHLLQYAVMGAAYWRLRHGRRARVGLLANASETHKGTSLTRETHASLRDAQLGFDYAGYVEGRDVFSGEIDVIVCDGFTGNLVLKVTEGAADAIYGIAKDVLAGTLLGKLLLLPLLPALGRLKRRFDYAEWGGAPLLGVQEAVVICHGGSNAKAIKNAILAAATLAGSGLPRSIAAEMNDHHDLFAQAKRTAAGGDSGAGQKRESDETSANSIGSPRGARESADECRSRAAGRHQRRLDHGADGDQTTPRP